MHKLVYTASAAKEMLKIPREVAKTIREKLELVAQNPYGAIPNAKKLQGREGYRLRVGDWRVIYEIDKEKITILVLKVASRGEVYK